MGNKNSAENGARSPPANLSAEEKQIWSEHADSTEWQGVDQEYALTQVRQEVQRRQSMLSDQPPSKNSYTSNLSPLQEGPVEVAFIPSQPQNIIQPSRDIDGVTLTQNPLHSSATPTAPSDNTNVLKSSLTPADFELISVIGKGSFGKVFEVRKKDTGKIYAMKVLKKDYLFKRKQIAHTQAERRILENITHPFIVSLRFAFQTPEKLYFVLDYFTGGELFFHLKRYGCFPEVLACFYCAELILAIEALHASNIIYRDLKPENILLDSEGHVRLTDFGLSKEVDPSSGHVTTFCGTPEYIAPEIICGIGYGKAVDWWSLGTLIYELIGGLPPFFNTNVNVMYERILNDKLVFDHNRFSPVCQDFLSRLLVRHPEERLGYRGAYELKNHPWFSQVNWDDLYNKRIAPLFNPHAVQTTNIDEEFLSLPVSDTPVQHNELRFNFPQFSYQSPDTLDK